MRVGRPDDSGTVNRTVCNSPPIWLTQVNLGDTIHHQISGQCYTDSCQFCECDVNRNCGKEVDLSPYNICFVWILNFVVQEIRKYRRLNHQQCRCYSYHPCGDFFFWRFFWTLVSRKYNFIIFLSKITCLYLARLLYIYNSWGNLNILVSRLASDRYTDVSNLSSCLEIQFVGLYWTRKHYSTDVEFEFIMTLTVKNTVIWFVAPCSSVSVWRLVRTYCHLHQGWRLRQVSWVSSEMSGSLQTVRSNNPEDRSLYAQIFLSSAFNLPLLVSCLVTLRSWRWRRLVPSGFLPTTAQRTILTVVHRFMN